MTQPLPPQSTGTPVLPPAAGTVTAAPNVLHVPPQHVGMFAGIKRIFSFIGWVLTGFGLIGVIRRHQSGRSRSEEIILYTVHRSFYLWSLILVGFVGSFCVRTWPGSVYAWGWIYVFVLLYTFASLLFDVSTMKALLWGGIFMLLYVSSKYLEATRHIVLLGHVRDYLLSLQPQLDRGMASVVSWLLLLPWIGSLFNSFTRGRKAFSPNSIEERFMGEGREILDRSGLKFRTRYRDLIETILGLGAGDIEAIDNNQHIIKRWENILFLAFVWPKLDEILHQRSAVVDNAPDQPVEVEQAPKSS